MRRGAILVVPMRVFSPYDVWLPKQGRVESPKHRGHVLTILGVCEAAIQACDRWWEDFEMDTVMFRFRTEGHKSTLPEWPEQSSPYRFAFSRDHWESSEYGVDKLNSCFQGSAIDDPSPVILYPRRLLSLEG